MSARSICVASHLWIFILAGRNLSSPSRRNQLFSGERHKSSQVMSFTLFACLPVCNWFLTSIIPWIADDDYGKNLLANKCNPTQRWIDKFTDRHVNVAFNQMAIAQIRYLVCIKCNSLRTDPSIDRKIDDGQEEWTCSNAICGHTVRRYSFNNNCTCITIIIIIRIWTEI